MAEKLFILTRAVHFTACLLIVGGLGMDLLIVLPAARNAHVLAAAWRSILRRLLVISLPVALVTGAAWFAFVAMEMSDLPFAQAIKPQVLGVVWRQTQFGHVWQIRGVLWIATALLAIAAAMSARRSIAPAFAMSVLLAASLAWSGHGQTNGPVSLHFFVDVIHIVAGGFWPAGLVPLAMILHRANRIGALEQMRFLATVVRRFSAMSLTAVAMIAASGLANSWFLLGSWSNFYRTPYGLLLAGKVAVFGVMLLLGARNLLKWKPAIAGPGDPPSLLRAVNRLRWNVLIESVLAAMVLVLVGALGIAPPPIDATPASAQVSIAREASP